MNSTCPDGSAPCGLRSGSSRLSCAGGYPCGWPRSQRADQRLERLGLRAMVPRHGVDRGRARSAQSPAVQERSSSSRGQVRLDRTRMDLLMPMSSASRRSKRSSASVVRVMAGAPSGRRRTPGRPRSRSARTSARWRARRPESDSIWVRQLKPSASRGAVGIGLQRRQQLQLGDLSGDALVAGLGTEVAGQAAAALQFRADDDAVALTDAAIGVEAQHRLLVAVRLGDGGRWRQSRPAGADVARPGRAAPPASSTRPASARGSRVIGQQLRAGPSGASWRRTAPAPAPARRRPARARPASAAGRAWPCPAGRWCARSGRSRPRARAR